MTIDEHKALVQRMLEGVLNQEQVELVADSEGSSTSARWLAPVNSRMESRAGVRSSPTTTAPAASKRASRSNTIQISGGAGPGRRFGVLLASTYWRAGTLDTALELI